MYSHLTSNPKNLRCLRKSPTLTYYSDSQTSKEATLYLTTQEYAVKVTKDLLMLQGTNKVSMRNLIKIKI